MSAWHWGAAAWTVDVYVRHTGSLTVLLFPVPQIVRSVRRSFLWCWFVSRQVKVVDLLLDCVQTKANHNLCQSTECLVQLNANTQRRSMDGLERKGAFYKCHLSRPVTPADWPTDVYVSRARRSGDNQLKPSKLP